MGTRTTTNSAWAQAARAAQAARDKAANALKGTTTTTSSGGQTSSSYNALEKEMSRKRVANNMKLILDVKNANSDVKELREMIAQAEEMLANGVTGEKNAEYKKMLANLDAKLQQTGNELNAAGAEAGRNIQKEGTPYVYNNTNTNPSGSYTTSNKETLSVDTNELRKLESLLENIENKSKDVEYQTSKIYDASHELGVTTGTYVASAKNATNTATTLKNSIKQQINDTEKTESDNLSVVDKIATWLGNLFGKETTTTTSDKDEKKWDEENPAWAQAVETAISSTGTRTRTTTSTKKALEDLGTETARKEHILIKNQDTAFGKIKNILYEDGIDTSGKSRAEILKLIVENYGIGDLSTDKKTRFRRNKKA